MRWTSALTPVAPAEDVSACCFSLENELFAVIRTQALAPQYRAELSHAECTIVRRLLLGQSYRDIAAARCSSTKTIANQVSRLLRIKLYVDTQHHLAERLQPRLFRGPLLARLPRTPSKNN